MDKARKSGGIKGASRRGTLAALLALAALIAPAMALGGVTMEFQCKRFVFTGLDLPETLQSNYTIRVTIEPRDPIYVFDSGIWEVADLPVAHSEVELNFSDLGALVEPGKTGVLRQFNGNGDLLDDEWRFSAPGSGTINVEDHVVFDYGLNFTSDDVAMIRDYLGDPAAVDLGLANWGQINEVECFVRLNWLRRPDLPLAVLRSSLVSITSTTTPDHGDDPDGDGRITAEDNCPAQYNPGQDNQDGDQVGDACDSTFSRKVTVLTVAAGDRNGFRDALNTANTEPEGNITEIRLLGDIALGPPPVIGTPPPGVGDPVETLWISRDVRIVGWPLDGPRPRLYNTGNVDGLRFATVQQGAKLGLRHVEIHGFDAAVDGGAVKVEAGGNLVVVGSYFHDNQSTGDGGVIHYSGGGALRISDSVFSGNSASSGGALFLEAPQAGPGDIRISGSRFDDNDAGQGCDLYADVASAELDNLVINQDCGGSNVLANGGLSTTASTLSAASGSLLDAGAPWRVMTTVLEQGACLGTGLASGGWNFAADNSCSLGQSSDLSGVDPRLQGPDANGLRKPQPGSPLIDAGPATPVTRSGETRPELPCGWKDATGLGRPQDGDGDGRYECDIGAVEVTGAGAIEPGHSGAFYNPQRSGEGQYVEILPDDRAVIYTFTYRPDSGPAWFLTTADIVGNSLVSNATIRPSGTPFGTGFDATSVWRAPWGGLSMVFPDCEAGPAQPGNAVYSGSADGYWEPLVTRAQRLTHVAGCTGTTPSANAGLSGSFYDPGRSGEGVVVQWLPNGDVLAIMFTYDLAGEQFWMFGTGTPNGRSVSFDAFYPAGDAAWGGQFDPGAVGLQAWGTFTLDYQDCDQLQFSYVGPSLAWGSATRSYRRLSKLAGTSCPAF